MSPLKGIGVNTFFVDKGSFFPIATTTVGSGGVASVTFDLTGVTGYTHLQIRGIARTDRASSGLTTFNFTFNNTGGTSYAYHYLSGNGTSASAGSGVDSGDIAQNIALPRSGDGASGSEFGAFIIDILDYSNTNKYKTIRTFSGTDLNGSGTVRGVASGLFKSTNAITSIKFEEPNGGSNITQYSHFALYGIKA